MFFNNNKRREVEYFNKVEENIGLYRNITKYITWDSIWIQYYIIGLNYIKYPPVLNII